MDEVAKEEEKEARRKRRREGREKERSSSGKRERHPRKSSGADTESGGGGEGEKRKKRKTKERKSGTGEKRQKRRSSHCATPAAECEAETSAKATETEEREREREKEREKERERERERERGRGRDSAPRLPHSQSTPHSSGVSHACGAAQQHSSASHSSSFSLSRSRRSERLSSSTGESGEDTEAVDDRSSGSTAAAPEPQPVSHSHSHPHSISNSHSQSHPPSCPLSCPLSHSHTQSLSHTQSHSQSQSHPEPELRQRLGRRSGHRRTNSAAAAAAEAQGNFEGCDSPELRPLSRNRSRTHSLEAPAFLAEAVRNVDSRRHPRRQEHRQRQREEEETDADTLSPSSAAVAASGAPNGCNARASPATVRAAAVRSPDRGGRRERGEGRERQTSSPAKERERGGRRHSRSPQRNGRKRRADVSRVPHKQRPEQMHYEVDTLFDAGFLEYYLNGVVTDLTLLFYGREYRVHRLIIAHASRHFYRLLKEHSGDSLDVTLPEIEYDSLQELFQQIIEYMYTGRIEFSPESSLPLLVVADKFELEHLHKLAVTYISQNIERENALQMLQQALRFQIKEIQDEATEVVSRNFSYIYDADYTDFPPEVMKKILSNSCLNVRAEYALYKQVLRYVKRRRPALTAAEVEDMMGCIRFRWFSLKELHQANKNAVVPRNLLIEALLIKLEDTQVGKAVPAPEHALHLQPRKNLGLSFEYKSKYKREDLKNCKGILHWLATDHGRQERRNPHTTGDVKVTASSVEKGNPEELVGAQPCELWTKDVPSSWFSLDFGARRVRVNCYSLRHGGNYRADSLRTWDFQGSNDGSNWVLLRRHTNDDSLDGAFCVGSWEVPHCDEAYRYFRILQTGHNSSINNYLVASGVELYGTLYESSSDIPQ